MASAETVIPQAFVVPSSEQLGYVGVRCREGEVGGVGGHIPNLESILYWGICDLKYDPRFREVTDRLKVLELGDAKTSRFSLHGLELKRSFERRFQLSKDPLRRAALVENKQMTHDQFVRTGFAHLRPTCGSYLRRYDVDLHWRILVDLGISSTDVEASTTLSVAIVLKLCNRCRGAGIVVVSARGLDNVLALLLKPPEEDRFDKWLEERCENWLSGVGNDDNLAEACLHWWSNECPVFLAERCCSSIPVKATFKGDLDKGGRLFDGTMRVAFVLRWADPGIEADGHKCSIVAEVLGAYWKLPPLPLASGPDLVRAQIVSSFGCAGKCTATVASEHLSEVRATLEPALGRVFETGALSTPALLVAYKHSPLFLAFVLTRVAASLRAAGSDGTRKALGLLDLATSSLPSLHTASIQPLAASLPERGVVSYVSRMEGVCHAAVNSWSVSSNHFEAAVRALPFNASGHYLLGCLREQEGRLREALVCHRRACALDPDFRSPLASASGCLLRLGKPEDALAACSAGLGRHPESPLAQYYAGQALLVLLCKHKGSDAPGDDALVSTLSSRGAEALRIARDWMPNLWSPADDAKLKALAAVASSSSTLELQSPGEPSIWPLFAWRP